MANYKDVFHIEKDPKGGKSRWTKLGVAFINQDGSLNLKLNALPPRCDFDNVQIREHTERPERGDREKKSEFGDE